MLEPMQADDPPAAWWPSCRVLGVMYIGREQIKIVYGHSVLEWVHACWLASAAVSADS